MNLRSRSLPGNPTVGLLLAGILLAGGVQAQNPTGTIVGTVTDANGGALPGVTVTADSQKLQGTRVTQTGANGAYRLAFLPPGLYRVTYELEGFSTVVSEVQVLGSRTVERNVSMPLGEVVEEIVVSGSTRRVSRSPTVRARTKTARASTPTAAVTYDREEYDHEPESGFRSAASRPLSTFSIDVDTASYTNVRRFLSAGQLPPPDAVRIEELLNYFQYADAPPVDGRPLAVHVDQADCPWAPEHRLVRIGLRGRVVDAAARPSLNLVFLIDVSGSMQSPAKLPLVQQSLDLLVDGLDGGDTVSMVVYAGAAGVVLEPTSGADRSGIRSAIHRLQAGGSTAGGEGIERAYELARESYREGAVNRVVLATDGDFNVGISDRGRLLRRIEKEAKSGVFLTVLGYGTGNLRDSTLEQLADHGNGSYAYVDGIGEARRIFVDQGVGTLVTIAKDVKIQVEWNPAQIASYRLIGYENRTLAPEDFDDDLKDAGELGAGHSVVALYEVVPVGSRDPARPVPPLRYQAPRKLSRAADTEEILTVALRWKEPDADRSDFLEVSLPEGSVPFDSASDDFRFGAAVAVFGMLLRDSEHRGDADWMMVRRMAQSSQGQDPYGHRSELVELVDRARDLASRQPGTTSSPARRRAH